MVNLEWYRSFVAIYRSGTVSGAAQALHLTQPAVSQHLAALETALGQRLFQRLPRKMLPTAAGKSLYTQVVAAIEQLASITDRTAAQTPTILRLGTPPEFFAEQLLPHLPPDAQYRITFGLAANLIEQLLAGELDAAIATQKIARIELEYQLITEEHFWLVAPPTNLMPIDPTINLADLTSLEQWLKTQPLIAYDEDLPIIRRFWRVVFGRRLDIKPKLVLPDLRLIRQAIATGRGFSVLPDYLCRSRSVSGKESMVASSDLRLLLAPTPAITNQIWLAYRKSEKQSPSIQVLLNLITTL